jgi:hypothetical protein
VCRHWCALIPIYTRDAFDRGTELTDQPEVYAALTGNTGPDRFDVECGIVIANEADHDDQ